MKRIAILTDFVSHEPAYSLCRVVVNQVKMIGDTRVIARHKDETMRQAYGEDIWLVDPGEIGNNVVNITDKSGEEIESLLGQLRLALEGCDVVITHDLIYQANMWKYHVAARRLARERSDLQWLHWVHSATDMGTVKKTERFMPELVGKFPNSRLVVFHNEELNRKGGIFGYEVNEIVVIPNPIDIMEGYHHVAREALEGFQDADVIACYPCRLDRGKQPHILVEVFAELVSMGYKAGVVIIDFHSTAGDKATYRDEMKKYSQRSGIDIVFTSDIPGSHYDIPHKAVMDLFEFADILLHPSMSESDPLIIPEAMWKRCGLVLNFDLPMFRQYDGKALLYKFSSAIDVHTGQVGKTKTEYSDRKAYMKEVAAGIAYIMQNNPVLAMHAHVRKTRGLQAVWNKHLWPAIEQS